MIGYVARMLRHLFYERSYARYYSSAAWERVSWKAVHQHRAEERHAATVPARAAAS